MRSRPNQASASWYQTFIAFITLVWIRVLFERVFGRADNKPSATIRRLQRIAERNRQRVELEERERRLQAKREEAQKAQQEIDKAQRRLRSRKRAESAPPVPVEKPTKPQSRRNSVRAVEQRPRSQTLGKTQGSPQPRLMTFSAIPRHLLEMQGKPPVEPAIVKPVAKPISKKGAPLSPDEQDRLKRLMQNVAITTDIIPDQVRKIKRVPLPEGRGVIGLARSLAIAYQVHRLNLLCKFVQKDNANKMLQFKLRTDLVHRLSPRVLDPDLLHATQGAVSNLDFSELALSAHQLKVDADRLTCQLENLPLFQHVAKSADIPQMKECDAKKWLITVALPIFNAVTELAAEGGHYQDKITYYDAQRMLIILIGEQCGGISEHDKRPLSLLMRAFRELRNELAHHAIPKNESRQIGKLLELRGGIDVKAVNIKDDAVAMLFQAEAKPQNKLLLQTQRRGSSHI